MLSQHSNMAFNVMTSALESEVYWSLKNEVLIELRELLVDKLQYEKTLDYLRSKRVFDRADCDEIEAERTPTKKRAKFLDILGDKGPTAFDQLCFAIQKKCKGQEYLLDIILTTFDRKKQERSKPLYKFKHILNFRFNYNVWADYSRQYFFCGS